MCARSEQATLAPLTSSAAASLARISATRERVLDWLVRALDSGPSTLGSLANYCPASSSWKTSQRSLLGDSPPFSGTSPLSGTMRSGFLSVLLTWFDLRASDVGAPHRRERLFIVAYARRGQVQRRGESREFPSSAGEAENAGDERKRMRYSSSDGNQALANPGSCRCERGAVEQPRGDGTRYELHREQVASDTGKRCTTLADADDKHDNRGRPSAGILPERRSPEARLQRQRSQSRLGREHTGFSAWLDRGFPAGPSESSKEWEAARTIKTCPDRPARLKALGNAVLPQVAYVIGCIVQELAQAASKGGG